MNRAVCSGSGEPPKIMWRSSSGKLRGFCAVCESEVAVKGDGTSKGGWHRVWKHWTRP